MTQELSMMVEMDHPNIVACFGVFFEQTQDQWAPAVYNDKCYLYWYKYYKLHDKYSGFAAEAQAQDRWAPASLSIDNDINGINCMMNTAVAEAQTQGRWGRPYLSWDGE